jgi:hypothetical protein
MAPPAAGSASPFVAERSPGSSGLGARRDRQLGTGTCWPSRASKHSRSTRIWRLAGSPPVYAPCFRLSVYIATIRDRRQRRLPVRTRSRSLVRREETALSASVLATEGVVTTVPEDVHLASFGGRVDAVCKTIASAGLKTHQLERWVEASGGRSTLASTCHRDPHPRSRSTRAPMFRGSRRQDPPRKSLPRHETHRALPRSLWSRRGCARFGIVSQRRCRTWRRSDPPACSPPATGAAAEWD